MKANMPKANVEKINSNFLTEEERKIINVVVKKNGTIRASKPNVKKEQYINGKAAYVWRMVAFYVSSNPQHSCMPVCANFDLPAFDENGEWKSAISREMEKSLDKLVDIIMDSIDKTKWHGVHRWGKALGY
jgi:hypothetical protein